MSRVLALDFASACGYAISPGTTSGVYNLAPRPSQRPGARYQKLRALLNGLLVQFPDLDEVVYEQALPGGQRDFHSALYAFGYIATLQLWCADKKIASRSVNVMTWRKYVCGKGNASKNETMEEIRSRGFRPQDHNESDAIGIVLWAMQQPKPDLLSPVLS